MCGMEEQEGAITGVLTPSQLVAVKTMVRMCGSAKEHALEPLRKLINITDHEWKTILEQLRRDYELSRLNAYRRNAHKPRKLGRTLALGGKPNKTGHKAGRPKNKRKINEDEGSSSQPPFVEASSPLEDEDFEATHGSFGPDDENLVCGADDSDIDEDEEERQELACL